MRFAPGLIPGDVIDNNRLQDLFKCSPQGKMRRSHRTNTLVIVSDHTKGVYEDRWVSNHKLHYAGMGLKGDQQLFHAQNRTLAESDVNGVEVFLFEVYKPKQYLYRGRVRLDGLPYRMKQPDSTDNLRQVWIFPLKIVEPDASYKVPRKLLTKKQKIKERSARKLSDRKLFMRAVHANKRPIHRQVASSAFERNAYVAELAKRRADGICQLCDGPAPFEDKNGEPYLEYHHIVWLSKGGEDTIENTVALCPNCHQKMHVLNLKSDIVKLKEEACKNCCQLTIDGKVIYV